jgi:hypothetical protein
MFTTIFPLPRYNQKSDDYMTRYFEILHTIGMTIHTMANDIESAEFAEKHLHLRVPHDSDQAMPNSTGDGTNNRTYRRSLQTSEELMSADRTIRPWEKVVLRACSFTLLLCMIEDYKQTAQMLDSIFFQDDEWTYFAKNRHIQTLIEKLPKPNVYALLRQTCPTMPEHVHPQTWIQSNLANWVEVCGKNISSFLQINQLPGGMFDASQRYICIVSSGEETRRYVGSIHILSKERNPTYLVMGILKHPMAERTCNQTDQYMGFVRTTLDGVQRFMQGKQKSIMWTFPLERMAIILRRRYGEFDPNELVSTFLNAIGMSSADRLRILSHQSGIFVYEHHM